MDAPDRDALAGAVWINLVRHPDTPAAVAFAGDVLERMLPHLVRKRPLGAKGLPEMRADLGGVLAGVMRPGLQGTPARVHHSSGGAMWDRSRGAAWMGRDRCWAILDAMRLAGLVEKVDGVRVEGSSDADSRVQLSAVVWPTDALVTIAAAHGVTADTRKLDWRSDASQRAAAVDVDMMGLVFCKPARRWGVQHPSYHPADMADLQADLRALNACNATADIRGAGHTVALVRHFIHSLDFHGRYYAPVSSVSAEDRQRITINGEAVAELDVSGSQLTVLLGITGQREAPADAYAIPGIKRDVVKAWVTQTLGGGAPVRTWSPEGAGARSGVKPGRVWEALRPRYGFLANLAGLVPSPALDDIPARWRGRAAGQWVTQREAAIVARAIKTLVGAGVPVLPIHDSLIVPASAVRAANDALVAAFVDLAGIVPRLKVTRRPETALAA